MNPGINVRPRPSIWRAPAGAGPGAPTDAMRPLRATSVPDSMTEPLPTMMRAFVITRSCAAPRAGLTTVTRHTTPAAARRCFMPRGYAIRSLSCGLGLTADDERPELREVHFLDRHRLQIGLRKEPGKIEV